MRAVLAALTQLGFDCVGADELGDRALDELRQRGVGTDHVGRDEDHPTGTVEVRLDAAGKPTFRISDEAAWDHVGWTEALSELAARAGGGEPVPQAQPPRAASCNSGAHGDRSNCVRTSAAGSMVSSLELGVDHELMRNVILGANGSLTRDDFEGISRTDYIYGAGADVTYLLNRYFSFGLDYGYQRRDADTAGGGYPRGPVTEGGRLYRLFDRYPNLFADLSAGSGLGALKRDPDHAFAERRRRVRAVVEAHEGSVDVASEPGSTRFTVRLPAAVDVPPAPAH